MGVGSGKCATYKMDIEVAIDGTAVNGRIKQQGRPDRDFKATLAEFARRLFGPTTKVRFRPSYFPFTEPSVEADMHWHDRWIEFGGAGMVDPNVLQTVGYDPEVYSGFAFGLGVERLCMRRHGITDIREFYRNDVRFLAQF